MSNAGYFKEADFRLFQFATQAINTCSIATKIAGPSLIFGHAKESRCRSPIVSDRSHAHKHPVPETYIIMFILWAVILGGAGGVLTTIGPWYKNLAKPSWQPPDWLFGPAWTLILGLCAWAGILAWQGAHTDAERTSIIILYAVNFVFHFLWSPLFFNLRRPDWALFEVTILWGSVLALCIGLRPYSVLASWLIVPYLSWVSFAAVLNLNIVRLNKPFGTQP